jgi:hypothetical protein
MIGLNHFSLLGNSTDLLFAESACGAVQAEQISWLGTVH